MNVLLQHPYLLCQVAAKATSYLRDEEPRPVATSRAEASPAQATSHHTYARQTGQTADQMRGPDHETSWWQTRPEIKPESQSAGQDKLFLPGSIVTRQGQGQNQAGKVVYRLMAGSRSTKARNNCSHTRNHCSFNRRSYQPQVGA